MRSMNLRFALVASAALLAGCAASVQRPESEQAALQRPSAPLKRLAVAVVADPAMPASSDWEAFRGEWRGAFTQAAADAGIGFAWVDAQPGPQPAGTTFARVVIRDYRYISTGARYGLGAFTGNAHVDARTEFTELPSGRRLGARDYSTTSSAWQGIFSAMTAKQVQALAARIIEDARGRP
ncbi:MAG: hypothetical protein QM766_12400 [Burkholderiaceae bacterium]